MLASPPGKVVNFLASSIETSVFFFAFPNYSHSLRGHNGPINLSRGKSVITTKGRYMEVINKLQAEKLSSLVMVNVHIYIYIQA